MKGKIITMTFSWDGQNFKFMFTISPTNKNLYMQTLNTCE